MDSNVARIVAGLRACVHDRETEKDPDVLPTRCRATGGSASQAVVRALTTAGLDTHRRDSLDAAETTALVTIGLIVLALGLGFLLPRTARPQAV